MKLLFLSDNFPPEYNAPATRTYEHCRAWVKQGVEVTVITCFPNFPHGKIYDGYKNKLLKTEYIDGIKVIRVWSYIAANKGFLKRILDFISYAIMAFLVGCFQKTDLIIGTSPQFFTAISARCLSVIKRKKWVMEVRDLWPESIAAVGALKKTSRIYKFLEYIEKQLYKSAALIVVVTDSFKTYLERHKIDSSKIIVVKNGVNLKKYQTEPLQKNLTKTLKLEHKFVISYIGTHGMAHALDFVLHTAKQIKDTNIHFLCLGDGAEKQNLLQLAKDLDLKNVTFLNAVSKDKIKDYINISHVALVNLKKSDTFKSVIPSKIFENAAMRKPILLGVEGESKALIESYNAGVTYTPQNQESFINAIEIIKNKDNYINYQKGCVLLAKDFDRDHLASKMLITLNNLY